MARKSRERHNAAPDGPKALDAQTKATAARSRATAPAIQDEVRRFRAGKLNSGAFMAASSIRIAMADTLSGDDRDPA